MRDGNLGASNTKLKSIVIFIDYFGAWPKWFPVFLASCKYNDTVNWIIRTDCEIPASHPENVKFVHAPYRDYVQSASRKLGIDFNPGAPYKICDLRPAYGELYYDDLADYDFFGFGDLDVIYGDIRQFYTDEVLSYDVISTHEGMLSGHLSLFRNTQLLRGAYRQIPNWKLYLEHPESTRFDEDIYSCLFVQRDPISLREALRRSGSTPAPDTPSSQADEVHHVGQLLQVKCLFKERYSTVFHPMQWHDGSDQHPSVWFWTRGRVTNASNGKHEYLYLHLMNFQSMRWTNPECRQQNIPWKDNPNVEFSFGQGEIEGVQIDWQGMRTTEPTPHVSRLR